MTQQNDLIETIVEGIQERKGKSITHVDMTGIEWVATQHFPLGKAHEETGHFHHAGVGNCRQRA